jgi:hypothetical protein
MIIDIKNCIHCDKPLDIGKWSVGSNIGDKVGYAHPKCVPTKGAKDD